MTWVELVAAEGAESSPVLLIVAVVSALGGGAGVTAMVRGLTTDRRAQRLEEDKASRQEFEAVRTENRALRKELSDLRDQLGVAQERAGEARRDKQAAEGRLERVEWQLAQELRRTEALEARVRELEGR